MIAAEWVGCALVRWQQEIPGMHVCRNGIDISNCQDKSHHGQQRGTVFDQACIVHVMKFDENLASAQIFEGNVLD